MKITLPKDLRGFAFDRVLPITLTSFEVDVLLPGLFFRTLSGGRDRGRVSNDPTQLGTYIAALATHPQVRGFADAQGQRTLERLVRTTLIKTTHQGTQRKSEQIQTFTGYTLLICKPGFPKETSALRKVDQLIYRMMCDQFGGEGAVREFLTQIFGTGVVIERGIEIRGTYDGAAELDTLTRLSIAFLDGFSPVGVKKGERTERPNKEACPPVAQAMARDLRRYMQAYHARMPVEAFTYHLKALISFELLIYSLKLFDAVSTLVSNPGTLPPGMHPNPNREVGVTPPQLYVDFTGEAAGLNRQMTITSVRGCLDLAQRFVRANLTLRQLDRYMRALKTNKRVRHKVEGALAADDRGPRYLLSLLQLWQDEEVCREIDASARRDVDDIRRENLPPGQDDSQEGEGSDVVDGVVAAATSDFEALLLLLLDAQWTAIQNALVKWLWNVGGLQKPYGILAGTLQGKGRHTWRFAPSNDLLATLVQLAAVNIGRWEQNDPVPQPVPLARFLDFIEERFGILVGRPPDGFAGAEYAAAAHENMRAMLRRLGQMGIFRDLSDDFTVQELIPPYMAEDEEVPA